MTKPAIITWSGVDATIYYLDKGDNIPRHRHNWEHTTCVLKGASMVYVWSDDSIPPGNIYERPLAIVMKPGDDNKVLPANIDHEIVSIEDGTIICNMAVTTDKTKTYFPTIPDQPPGGIMLESGEIVQPDVS